MAQIQTYACRQEFPPEGRLATPVPDHDRGMVVITFFVEELAFPPQCYFTNIFFLTLSSLNPELFR